MLDLKEPKSRSTLKFAAAVKGEKSIQNFIPFSSLVTADTGITRTGDYFRVWKLQGVAFETADDDWLLQRHEALCQLAMTLGGGNFSLWRHRVRRYIKDSLPPPHGDGFAAQFDQAFNARINEEEFLSTELYVTLVYRPYATAVERAMRPKTRDAEQVKSDLERALAVLDERSAVLESLLREFKPELLAERVVAEQVMDGGIPEEGNVRYSALAEFLGLLVNGKWRPIRAPVVGALHRILPVARLLVGGSALEFRNPGGTVYGAVADIKEYPDGALPGVFDPVLYDNCELIESLCFLMLSRREALNKLKIQRNQLKGAQDASAKDIERLDQAMEDVASGDIVYGNAYYSLMTLGKTAKEAQDNVARISGKLSQHAGVELSPVDLIAEAALYTSWPGNYSFRPREVGLSSRVVAAFSDGHNFPSGKRDGNPWGPALALLPTRSGQPFYLNIHESKEGEDNEDAKLPGNTVIFGGTGAGKTTLEIALLTMSQRFNPPPRLCLFSYQRDNEIFVRAQNGEYYVLSNNVPTGCNPFQRGGDRPSPQRIIEWVQLVREMLYNPQLPLLPSDEQAIARAVNVLATFPAKDRWVRIIRQNLPRIGQNSLFDRLGAWCQGGPNGWVFDSAPERLSDLGKAHVVGIDYTDIVDNPVIRAPMMLSLMSTMNEMIDGRRLIYGIAEAWRAFRDEVMNDFALNQQKTIRKKNGVGIFDTQSISDMLNAPNGRTIIDQCVTKIFLPNEKAIPDELMSIGLTRREAHLVKNMALYGDRLFMVKQGHRASICKMDLGGMDNFINVLSGTADNVTLLDEIRAEVGDDAKVWLPVFNQRIAMRKQALKRSS